MFSIKSILVTTHDSSFGGYPYKAIVSVDVTDLKAFKKLQGKLGSLVHDVNDETYRISNKLIPAYNPSVDEKRASKCVKKITFTYFFKDHAVAKAIGLDVKTLRNGESFASYGTSVSIPISKEVAPGVVEYTGADALNRIYG